MAKRAKRDDIGIGVCFEEVPLRIAACSSVVFPIRICRFHLRNEHTLRMMMAMMIISKAGSCAPNVILQTLQITQS